MTIQNVNMGANLQTQALLIGTRQMGMSAENLANQNTPGYKAKAIDFEAALKNAQDGNLQNINSRTTNVQHQNLNWQEENYPLAYRTNVQPSINGNTVDPHVEKAEATKAYLDIQANHRFYAEKMQNLTLVIKGKL